MLKKIARGIAILLVLVLLGAGAFALIQASAFDASVDKVYTVTPPAISASTDPEVIARGKHLTEIAGCPGCHGADLGGKLGEAMGPLGVVHAPNLTAGHGGVLGRYSDGAFARVIRDGIKSDGRSLRFMPAQDLGWWPDEDLTALVSYVRTLPKVDRELPPAKIGMIGKVLDRTGMIALDIARRIDHGATHAKTLEPAPTREYGTHLARSCTGCHGETFSGGAIPGAPSSLPIPSNITPHETGIKAYSEADFMHLLDTGLKKNGQKLNPFMPIEMPRAMNETERKALYTFLMSLPPKQFGQR